MMFAGGVKVGASRAETDTAASIQFKRLQKGPRPSNFEENGLHMMAGVLFSLPVNCV
jgi:hypothetical protein